MSAHQTVPAEPLQLEARIPLASLDEVLHTAAQGCRQVHEVLQATAEVHAQALLHSRGNFST